MMVHPNITIKDERPKTPVQIDKCRKRCTIHKKECELLVRGHEGKCAHSMPGTNLACTWEGYRNV